MPRKAFAARQRDAGGRAPTTDIEIAPAHGAKPEPTSPIGKAVQRDLERLRIVADRVAQHEDELRERDELINGLLGKISATTLTQITGLARSSLYWASAHSGMVRKPRGKKKVQ